MACAESLTIYFGTLYHPTKDELYPQYTYVVLDPSALEVAYLIDTDNGKAFGLSGTGDSKHIAEIVGRLNVDEVISAARTGAELRKAPFLPKQENLLRELALSEPVTIVFEHP